jgi:hypothetical protein
VNEKQRRFCDVYIEVPADPWAGTYCKLLAGHEGKHSAHYPPEPSPMPVPSGVGPQNTPAGEERTLDER